MKYISSMGPLHAALEMLHGVTPPFPSAPRYSTVNKPKICGKPSSSDMYVLRLVSDNHTANCGAVRSFATPNKPATVCWYAEPLRGALVERRSYTELHVLCYWVSQPPKQLLWPVAVSWEVDLGRRACQGGIWTVPWPFSEHLTGVPDLIFVAPIDGLLILILEKSVLRKFKSRLVGSFRFEIWKFEKNESLLIISPVRGKSEITTFCSKNHHLEKM